jgi:hypothetical protein
MEGNCDLGLCSIIGPNTQHGRSLRQKEEARSPEFCGDCRGDREHATSAQAEELLRIMGLLE